jgi:hypothetical protein
MQKILSFKINSFLFRVKKSGLKKYCNGKIRFQKKRINKFIFLYNFDYYYLQKYKKLKYFFLKKYYIKYISRCNFLVTKNNFLIYCYNLSNTFLFQITLKQIGFKKKKKKSPFVIAVFFDLLYYHLISNYLFNIIFIITGKNKFLKWYLKQLLYTKKFFFQKILRNIRKNFNGCKLSNKRRL